VVDGVQVTPSLEYWIWSWSALTPARARSAAVKRNTTSMGLASWVTRVPSSFVMSIRTARTPPTEPVSGGGAGATSSLAGGALGPASTTPAGIATVTEWSLVVTAVGTAGTVTWTGANVLAATLAARSEIGNTVRYPLSATNAARACGAPRPAAAHHTAKRPAA